MKYTKFMQLMEEEELSSTTKEELTERFISEIQQFSGITENEARKMVMGHLKKDSVKKIRERLRERHYCGHNLCNYCPANGLNNITVYRCALGRAPDMCLEGCEEERKWQQNHSHEQ